MLVETLGGTAVAAGALAYAVRSPRSSLLAPSVFHGVAGRRAIALTFDDGPSESTPALLDVLSRFGIRATFFHCGANVRRLPAIARLVSAAGHEIGNHTDTHPLLHFRSAGVIYDELARAQQTIQDTVGIRPRLFRPPYGVRWFGLRAAQRALGLGGVMWTVLGLDWKRTSDQVASRLLSHTRSGAIACLHDGRLMAPRPDISATIEAVQRVAPRWIDEGFRFETVSEILCPTN
jgi:peptidoglycan/xylan/chitin deacetylase (PgdA/CDA1 family)